MQTSLDCQPTPTLFICRQEYPTHTQSFYLKEKQGPLDVFYIINQIGGMNREVDVNVGMLSPVTVAVKDMQYLLNYLHQINFEYKNALLAIGKRLGWECPKDGSKLLDIRAWKINMDLSTIQALDLSNLGLTMIPPQIQLFTGLVSLNLAGNNLHLLPPELQYFRSSLKELNISQNVGLQPNIPAWLTEFNNLKLYAYGMGEIFLDDPAGKVSIESDVKVTRYHRQRTDPVH